MIYNKRGAARRDQAPAETKRTDRQNRNAERTKASPLNRLAIAFVFSLGGVFAFVVFGKLLCDGMLYFALPVTTAYGDFHYLGL